MGAGCKRVGAGIRVRRAYLGGGVHRKGERRASERVRERERERARAREREKCVTSV